jgi:hypothetical protein
MGTPGPCRVDGRPGPVRGLGEAPVSPYAMHSQHQGSSTIENLARWGAFNEGVQLNFTVLTNVRY